MNMSLISSAEAGNQVIHKRFETTILQPLSIELHS